MTLLPLFATFVLFLVALRLSAFFSGSETGFYRVSIPRLSIDAQAGDRVARRLLWFARNPASFVATTLVGNNIANYLTTVAISLAVVELTRGPAEVWEVVATMLISPIVYLFGELVPKNLYYRAPMALLRRNSRIFSIFYWLLIPASLPLVLITRLLERFSPETGRRTELVFGRSRLVQLLHQGRHEGLLTDVQNRLASGVLQTAPERVAASMMPFERILGVSEDATREQVLEFAGQHALSSVIIHHKRSRTAWFAYVRTVDVALDSGPLSRQMHLMPVLAPGDGKLDALQTLYMVGEVFAVVKDGDRVLGVVNSRELSEQLFRSALSVGPAT